MKYVRHPLSLRNVEDLLGHVSKIGNGYLRRLLVIGATSVTRRAETAGT